MARSVRTVERMAFTAAATAILIAFILPGCSQNQDNSPISISPLVRINPPNRNRNQNRSARIDRRIAGQPESQTTEL